MTHKRGYENKVKFKNYDRMKNKIHDKRIHNYMRSEVKINQMIKNYEEELKEMKLEMEMY